MTATNRAAVAALHHIVNNAEQLIAQNRLDEAKVLLHGASHFKSAQVAFLLGRIAQICQQGEEALTQFSTAAMLDRGSARFRFYRGVALQNLQRVIEAADSYRDAIRLDPKPADYHYNLAVVLAESGEHAAAIRAYQQTLIRNPKSVEAYNNLANILAANGDWNAAIQALKRAIVLKPDFVLAHNNLGRVYANTRQFDLAITHFSRAIEIQPNFAQAMANLADQYHKQGDRDNALHWLDRALQLEPNNEAAHFTRNIMAGTTPESVPVAYIRGLMDELAPRFDEHLTQHLGYKMPQLLHDALRPWLNANTGAIKLADLGCGTGLLGVEMLPYKQHFVGVDVSPLMLQEARKRGIYDRLIAVEIATYLGSVNAHEFNLVAAADVFVYVGALESVFREVNRVLDGSGKFIFSIELNTHDDKGFHLTAAGRYSHAKSYIGRLADDYKFVLEQVIETTLRTENAKPILGVAYVMATL